MVNSKHPIVNATYDPVSGCGYIYLDGPIASGGVAHTVMCAEGINLDLDHEGRLIGIELIDGRRLMPKHLAAKARVYGYSGGQP